MDTFIKNEDGTVSRVNTIEVDVEREKAAIKERIRMECEQVKGAHERIKVLKANLATLGTLDEEEKI